MKARSAPAGPSSSGVLVGSWWHAVDTLGLAGGSAVPGGGSAPGCVEGDVTDNRKHRQR